MKESKTVSMLELTKLEGLSRQAVHLCIRAGLPHRKNKRGRLRFDPSKVRAWRVEHSHAGNLWKRPGSLAGTPTPKKNSSMTEATFARTPIERLAVMEADAFRDYLSARNLAERRGLRSLHADVAAALALREKTDGWLLKQKEKWWIEARSSVVQWGETIKGLLDQAPAGLAALCNPGNPSAAESALRTWLDKSLYPMLHKRPGPSAGGAAESDQQ